MSNILTPDSTISNRDRAIRAKELGQTVFSLVEHGWMGRVVDGIELSKELEIKPLLGTEAYFVKNRLEKDKTNAHIILLAKNEKGRKAINWALSEANISGFYYKPRLDLELILGLPENDVWVTTACLAGVWQYDDYEDIICQFASHFKRNFFLEVQNHDTLSQEISNGRIINLSNKHNIAIIAGMDSHMIYSSQKTERDNYLLSRGISYPEEEGWFLDFPSYDEARNRFKQQGILNNYQIDEALNNTNIFENVEKYDSPIFDNSIIKLPSLYSNKNQQEKNQLLSDLVYSIWEQEKLGIKPSELPHYEQEIKKELAVIFETKMTDYFLLDYEIIKKGKNMGGNITMTGRGSAASFYLSKLLGFTTIDRISSTVKLFPERFISSERLLETHSLPDIDFNLGNPEIFAEAQQEVLGIGHSYQMIAFGTIRDLGAWKLYARVAGIDFETANVVSDQIKRFEKDTLYNEESIEGEKDIFDYIDEKHRGVYEQSRKYLGLVNSITPHPCAYLIYNDDDIRKEFGLIKIKTGEVEHICACCDGLFAEDYKLLKNDLLKVTVVEIIHDVYKKIGIEPHSLPQLIEICKDNPKVWEIYKNGWTVGINQVEPNATRSKATKYCPQNISELSAFVAAIRPGFKSNYKQFESREPFSYGISSLDELIQTKEFPQSYLLYQENAMQVLSYAGIKMSESYDVIKNIAKKRTDKVLKYKQQFIRGMKKRIGEQEKTTPEEASKIANMTWQIVDDSCRYSFNASHAYSVAGDSLYGAYLKSHYPLEFYETILELLERDGDKDRLIAARNEAEKAFGITFPRFSFGQDNRKITSNKERNEITSSLRSIKGFGKIIGEQLYGLYQEFGGSDFLDLLVFAEESGCLSKKWEDLIKVNYFKDFGNNKKLLDIYKEFKEGKNRYNKTLKEDTKNKRIKELKILFSSLPDERLHFLDQVIAEEEILGYIHSIYPKIDKRYVYVLSLDTKFSPRIQAYCLNNGKQASLKVQNKIYENKPFIGGDILFCKTLEKKPQVRFVDGNFVEDLEAEEQWWISSYDIIDINNFDEKVGE